MMNSTALSIASLRPAPGSTANRIAFAPAVNLRDTGQPRKLGASAADALAASSPGVHFHPATIARRQTAQWRGLSGEIVRIVKQEPFEIAYRGPSHLLIVYERAARHKGESVVEGLPRSTLRDFSQKLTFVPAGRTFREWQDPRVPTRVTYLHIDPQGMAADPAAGLDGVELTPRLFFDSPVLWQTALKLKALIEAGPSTCGAYAEALGVVLTHELLRLNSGIASGETPVRGGLASLQRRVVTQYLEENLAEKISLAKLAELAELSPFHFSRAFKQSFGMPPHRYHTSRRIERAKMLLAKPNLSVTEIALEMGFSETSSFTAVFRKLAGRTPTDFRRSLV
jgi:AraC family transcriptional regulator